MGDDEKTTTGEQARELSPEERVAQAEAARAAGDPRPATQIEGEALGQADDREQRRVAREQRAEADKAEAEADRVAAERAAHPGREAKHAKQDKQG